MPEMRKSLLQFIFSGAYMRRWNDKMRPKELYEIDKQAHKMIVAFCLLDLNSMDLSLDERLRLETELIESALFDYIYRLVVTDIKPPIFYRMKENKAHFRQLTDWVLEELEPILRPFDEDFWQRLKKYHTAEHTPTLARRILEVAHLFASNWEFQLIRPFNDNDDELVAIEESFAQQMAAYHNESNPLKGLNELCDPKNGLGRLALLCGRLRFQIRWSETPRLPETSVLGHMFLVACYSYLFSLSVGACSARCNNNFFCGLFHDMPELLTRDIISPVKRSVEKISDIIRVYEREELQSCLFFPLQKDGFTHLAERLWYFLGLDIDSEFDESVCINQQTCKIASFAELHTQHNKNEENPKDGALLKACDNLAAFIEAHSSLRNGVVAPSLQEAVYRFQHEYKKVQLGSLALGALFADFD